VTSTQVSATANGPSLREERRPAALAGWLVRRGSDEAHDFLITDLSYRGCRLETAASLAHGDEVKLTVLRRGVIPARVQWHNGHGVGLAFSSEEPIPQKKPRKVERLPLRAELAVRRTGRRSQVLDVSDLSRHGCCLSFNDPPQKGDWIWVSLPGLAPIQARVRWTDARRAGVEFVHPIYDAVFELLLLRWGVNA
jgi:hypothetical protein